MLGEKESMTRFDGISPISDSTHEWCDLYAFTTKFGPVHLHEVDCLHIVYIPTAASLEIEFAWDLESPVSPPSPWLDRFSLTFANAAILEWTSRYSEVNLQPEGDGQVRRLEWNRFQTFHFALASEQLIFLASACRLHSASQP